MAHRGDRRRDVGWACLRRLSACAERIARASATGIGAGRAYRRDRPFVSRHSSQCAHTESPRRLARQAHAERGCRGDCSRPCESLHQHDRHFQHQDRTRELLPIARSRRQNARAAKPYRTQAPCRQQIGRYRRILNRCAREHRRNCAQKRDRVVLRQPGANAGAGNPA